MPSIYDYLTSHDPNYQNRIYTDYGFDPRGNNEIGTEFSKGAMALYPEFARELDWMSSYQGPQQRALIEDLVRQLNDPGAQRADYNQYAQGAYENAAQSGNLLANQLRGAGYGSGATGGRSTGGAADALSSPRATVRWASGEAACRPAPGRSFGAERSSRRPFR